MVENNVCGKDDHKLDCVDKILNQIKDKNWQNKYSVQNFVFLLYRRKSSIEISDIKTMLSCQIIEILDFYENNNSDFKEKFKDLFEVHYGFKPSKESQKAIRAVRNNLAHTGSINFLKATMSKRDKKAINNFVENKNLNNIRPLAAEVDYLVADIVTLGLDDDDLKFNGRPPQKNDHFN